MNMSEVITPKSDQINADDLIGGPKTITIERVEIRGGQEQPVSIFFKGSPKAYRPCKSMSRVMVFAWGPDAKLYTGRSLTIYRDPSVKWGGMEVGGIRISHMSDITEPLAMALTATKGRRAQFVVRPLANAPVSAPVKPVEQPPVKEPESEVPFEAESPAAANLLDDDRIGKLQDLIGAEAPKAIDYLVNVKKWIQRGQGLQHLTAANADTILKNANAFMRAVRAGK